MKTRLILVFSQIVILQFCSFNIYSQNIENGRNNDNPIHYPSKDSSKLIHVYKQFYKNENGHLYQLTSYCIGEHDTLPWKNSYFTQYLPQDLDPFSFREIGLLFAKDNKFIYVCKPTTDGIIIYKIEDADVKSFKVIKGSLNAKDRKYVYGFFGEIIEGLDPHHLKIVRDKSGDVIKMISGKTVYDTKAN